MALRYCSRSGVFGHRAEFSRIDIVGVQKYGASEHFWRRSQPRLCRPAIARDREPSTSEQKIPRVDVIAVQNVAGLKMLTAISAVPMALRYCSRSGVFGKRAEFSRIDIIGVQKSGASENCWRRSQPRLWRPAIARDREPSASEPKFSTADGIAAQSFASDLSRAHGAPFLLEIESRRQLIKVLKDRHSRGRKNWRT